MLAVTGGPGGAARALVAVQRFGEGRSMVFTGEASWRWRMLLPTTDQSYERFWRQAVRWLAQNAPEPVTHHACPRLPRPATAFRWRSRARDGGYAPRADAVVDVRVTAPVGPRRDRARRSGAVAGRPVPRVAFARRSPASIASPWTRASGQTALGTSAATMLVGGVDPEMTDPRLNEDTLQRVARASGGAVLARGRYAGALARLEAGAPAAVLAQRQDLWHTGWSFAILAVCSPRSGFCGGRVGSGRLARC